MTKTLAALPLLFAAAAFGATPHETWVRSKLEALPVFHEDRGAEGKAEQLDELAAAIADVSRSAPLPPQQWAALMLTVGFHESGFSRRIIANECKSRECDRGRARGFGQVHANSLNREDWAAAPGDVRVQAKLTSDALKRAYWNCARSGVPAVQGTLSSFAGQRCGAQWRGLDERLQTFNRIVGRAGGKS